MTKLVILGDSQAAGLGVHGNSFALLAAKQLGIDEVLDLAVVSRTVAQTLAFADRITDFAPDIAILSCGPTESLVHPGIGIQRAIERWAPAKWHGLSSLNPRAYYSTNSSRRTRQRLASEARVALKHGLIPLTNAKRRVPLAVFEPAFRDLLRLLSSLSCQSYVVSLWAVDERLFPRTTAAFAETSERLKKITAEFPLASFVDIWNELLYWDDFLDDHTHWNQSGHMHVASMVTQAVARRSDPAPPSVT